MSAPRKNMTESILARAEAYRLGVLFDGVPKFTQPGLEMPAPPAADAGTPPAGTASADGADSAQPAPNGQPVVDGVIEGRSPLESLAVPQP